MNNTKSEYAFFKSELGEDGFLVLTLTSRSWRLNPPDRVLKRRPRGWSWRGWVDCNSNLYLTLMAEHPIDRHAIWEEAVRQQRQVPARLVEVTLPPEDQVARENSEGPPLPRGCFGNDEDDWLETSWASSFSFLVFIGFDYSGTICYKSQLLLFEGREMLEDGVLIG